MRSRPLIAAAIAAALAVPSTAGASDGALVRLSLAHIRSTASINLCEGAPDCAQAITENLYATTHLTNRATLRMYARPTAACLRSSRAYGKYGRREVAAARRFMAVGGGTAATNAYYDAAVTLDRQLPALVRDCG